MDRQPYSGVFAETRALVAIMEGDEDAARRILDDSYPNERRTFVEALNRLAALAESYCAQCGNRVENLTDLITIVGDGGRERICRDCDTKRAEEKRVVRARRKEIEKLVLDAVTSLTIDSYAHLAEVTGINVNRLADLRISRADATDEEIAKLRALIAERSVRP